MTTTFCWQIPTFCFHLFFVREFQPNELFVDQVESSDSFDLFVEQVEMFEDFERFVDHGEMFGDFQRFADHDETSHSLDLLVVQVESIEDSEVFVGQDESLDEFDLLVVPVESSDSLVFVGRLKCLKILRNIREWSVLFTGKRRALNHRFLFVEKLFELSEMFDQVLTEQFVGSVGVIVDVIVDDVV
jgi:hypothetical protein